MSIKEIENMIFEWNKKQVNDKYFEMFAIIFNEKIVGTISLYQHSSKVISIGPEIFEAYRKKGLAKEAMINACDIARAKGYKIVSQQIRTNNTASIALHRSLDFETNCHLLEMLVVTKSIRLRFRNRMLFYDSNIFI